MLRLYIHSSFIDTVLLYRIVCMQSIDVVEEYSRSCTERLLAVDDRPEETVSNSLILINNINI